MAGDMDTKLHPSHILEGISKISLLHVRLLVSKPQFLISISCCERSTTFVVSITPLHVDATLKTQFPVGGETS